MPAAQTPAHFSAAHRGGSPWRLFACVATAGLLPLLGCVPVTPPPPGPVTIELVNATGFDVRANLFTSATATRNTDLFVTGNLNTSWTDRAFPELRPLETRSLTLECSAAASLGVNAPTLFDAATLTVTPSADQIFLARDAGFSCDSTVRFVYFLDGSTFRVRVEFP